MCARYILIIYIDENEISALKAVHVSVLWLCLYFSCLDFDPCISSKQLYWYKLWNEHCEANYKWLLVCPHHKKKPI